MMISRSAKPDINESRSALSVLILTLNMMHNVPSDHPANHLFTCGYVHLCGAKLEMMLPCGPTLKLMCSSCSRCFRSDSNMEWPILSASLAIRLESSSRALCSSNVDEVKEFGEFLSLTTPSKASRADEEDIRSENSNMVPSSIALGRNGLLL